MASVCSTQPAPPATSEVVPEPTSAVSACWSSLCAGPFRLDKPCIRNVGLAIEELSGAQPNRASVEGTSGRALCQLDVGHIGSSAVQAWWTT